MRNEDRILTPSEAALVGARTRQLRPLIGKPVTLEYVKRDGTPGTATGPVVEIMCKGSKSIVTVDSTATKGRPTSINLYNVQTISEA